MAANAPQTPNTTRPVTPSAAESNEGPVLNLINKRLRALRKKSNRIAQMEESVAQGKILNKEQEETLKSKTVVLAQIDELEKLKQPLAAAVVEEHALAVKKFKESEEEEEEEKEARVSAEEGYVVVEEVKEETDKEDVFGMVGDVLKLVYFGSIFDVKNLSEFNSMMLTRTHERGCCLTYDYVTDDAVDVLGEKDLDFISQLGSFLTSRSVDSSLSHKDALERCMEHAKLWLANSEQPIGSDTNITYAGLRQRLDKIMASEYFTTTPEMTTPVDVAAAAAGNFGSYQVSNQGHNVSSQAEANVTQYEQQEEGQYQQENDDNEFNHVDQSHKEAIATDGYDVSSMQEQGYTQSEEQNQRDSSQYLQRRGYQNHGYQNQRGGRGGGRRGSNGRGFRGGGRGNGPYQNGRNQYFDQPGNYYPRNSNSGRGRGGRGAGGQGYNQYGSNAHAGHPASDTGVAS